MGEWRDIDKGGMMNKPRYSGLYYSFSHHFEARKIGLLVCVYAEIKAVGSVDLDIQETRTGQCQYPNCLLVVCWRLHT